MEFLAGGMLGFGLGWLVCSLTLLMFVKIKGRKGKNVLEN